MRTVISLLLYLVFNAIRFLIKDGGGDDPSGLHRSGPPQGGLFIFRLSIGLGQARLVLASIPPMLGVHNPKTEPRRPITIEFLVLEMLAA